MVDFSDAFKVPLGSSLSSETRQSVDKISLCVPLSCTTSILVERARVVKRGCFQEQLWNGGDGDWQAQLWGNSCAVGEAGS